jgi:cytochrome c-type biogenesis protein CcmH/NrfF
MRGMLALAAALAVLVTAVGAAVAATPRASLPDIEDEVMCLECGTALYVSDAPVAERERAFIRELIAQGKTKAEIKAALVAEFGPAVLAVPEDEGFGLAAWLVPLGLGLAAAAALALAVRRWRRRRPPEGGPAPGGGPGSALDPADERRLDAELAAYDR